MSQEEDEFESLEDDEVPASGLELDEDMEIGTPEELDELGELDFVDEVAAARSRLTVRELMDRLTVHPEEVAVRDLFVLSDLSRSESETVEQSWSMLPVDRRRLVVGSLVESADEVLELQLGRLLRIALHDSDPEVRRIAIEGLWEDVEPDLIGPLLQTLAGEDSPGVRGAAASALGSFVLAGELDELDSALTMRAEEALLALLHNEGEPLEVRCRALEAIAYSSETGLRQLIEDAYYSPFEEMRLSALRAMGRSADTRWRSMARAELNSPDASMRAEAARTCGDLEAKAAVPQLILLLEDPEHSVRLAAIDALGQLGGKDAREALRLMAAEAEETEAEAAEVALEEMLFLDETGAIRLLEDETDEDDEDEWENG
jgi:HEAT repeat protein